LMYANDFNGALTGTYDYLDDNLNWLYRNYARSINSFICPATQNFIRVTNLVLNKLDQEMDIRDLQDRAFTKASWPGHSYENFSWWRTPNEYSPPDPRLGTRKTESRVQRYRHRNVALGLRGTVGGPSSIWLQVDADDYFATYPGAINDYPDAGDNHGAGGKNANFCDGHAEWVSVKGKQYLITRELSQDEGKSSP
jgi:prepilin-type processing-associated H-X9-DG protein